METIRLSSATDTRPQDRLTVGVAQIAPVWLDRNATLQKVEEAVKQAAAEGCQLVVFGEALVPGYPFWVELTDGARFNDEKQKALYAHYLDQGVSITDRSGAQDSTDGGDLAPLCALAKQHGLAIYLGVMERAADRSGHSLYCSLVYIDRNGRIGSVHRKLQPTYEERLVWAQGDGHGLRVHDLPPFTVGGLNCFENWMPLSRAALYAQGEDLHVSVWPGGLHNTFDLPGFLAKESRSYIIASCGLMRPEDIPANMPCREEILSHDKAFFGNGGSTIAAPDGSFLIDPVIEREALIVADLDHALVRRERQNFDPAGHYSRPDITQLQVNRTRQSIAKFED
ncbi:carbon-nitrogen hydrolase family protein [Kiloniella sp. b19]|uniref:carbon-nitrogen hydrolase family protein n=1 Tax=Kiloniella sp. GXU_MW_B19 TaxID=3141326 RepID=UPI0031D9F0B0